MYRITLILKPDFNAEKFIISRCVYSTDSFVSAMFLIHAMSICCQDFTVSFGTGEDRIIFTPQKWYEYVRKQTPDSEKTLQQKELF